MNSTSPSSSLVRMAARSPARSSAGPEVTWSCTPISAATMPASVVLPRPGGPANSRWSAAWPRRRAASSTIARCSFSSAWPTKSASGAAGARHVGTGLGDGRRRLELAVVVGRCGSRNSSRTGRSQTFSAAAQQLGASPSAGELAQRARDLLGAVAEARPAPRARRRARAGRRPSPSRRSRRRQATSPSSRRAFSSTRRRAAVFLPTPGTRHRARGRRSAMASQRRGV